LRTANRQLKAQLQDTLAALKEARAAQLGGAEVTAAQASALQDELTSLRNDLTASREEFSGLQAQCSRAQADLDDSQSALSAAAAAAEQLEGETRVAVAEAQTLKEMNSKMKAKLKDVLQELQAARTGLDAAQAAAQAEVADLREELTRQAAASDARLAEAAAQLSSETEARARLETDQRAAPCPGATLLLGTQRLCAYPALCSTSAPASTLPLSHGARMLLS